MQKLSFVCIFGLMAKRAFILLFVVFWPFFITLAQNSPERRVVIPQTSAALKFTENIGQWNDNILFRARLDGGLLFFEKNCLTFNFYDKNKLRSIHNGGFEKKLYSDYNIICHAYKVHFDGCNSAVKVEKAQKGTDYENFYMGNDKTKWKGNVQNYHKIWIREIYDGIDYEAITSTSGIKYNFIVKPNSDPEDIKMRYEGVDKIKLKDGSVRIKLSITEIIEQKPYAYQTINGVVKEVLCKYRLVDNVLGFEFPNGYDKNQELVIDPVLVFAAQSGSTADNFGMTATFDLQGNLYSGGTIFDIGYPFVTGSYSNVFNGPPAYGNTDIVLTKYNSVGNALLFATYMGGMGTEVVSSLIVDKANNLYLYGATGSTNFPTTAGAAYPNFAGGSNIGFVSNGSVFFNGTDIYIAKFNPTGSALLGCTYYGGSGNDGVNYLSNTYTLSFSMAPAAGFSVTNTTNYDSLQTNYGDTYRGEIQLDTLNNVYIVSSTRSSDLPMVGGFDNTINGGADAVVAKFNTNLTGLIYSGFLGGSHNESGNGLFVLPNFEVYVTGGTCSSNFPNTAGGHAATYQGGKTDGFLTHINSAGNAIMQSTYIGTNLYDNSFFVQCNSAGQPHVYGQSLGNMPVIMDASATTIFSVANTHQFVTKYNAALTSKLMSTVFGNNTSNIDISPSAFAVDECNGNIYLSGWGGNILLANSAISNMPILNPTQATTTGYDFYLMAMKVNASSLLYGSYFGGNTSQEHVDGGTSRFDRKGVIYQSVCAGCGGNQDFPVTPNAWPCPTSSNCPTPNLSANCNNGVFKIDFQFQTPTSSMNTNTITGCAPLTVNFTNNSPGTGFVWHFGNGQTNSVTLNPSFTYTTGGTYTVSLVVYDTTKCVKKDSSFKVITVNPKPVSAFTSTLAHCSNTYSTSNTSTGLGLTYIWNFGDASPTTTLSSPNHTYTTSGMYTITLVTTNSFGCKDTLRQPINVFIFNPSASMDLICEGETASLTATGGTSYTWTPAATLNNQFIPNPSGNPTVTTVYTVTIENNAVAPSCLADIVTTVIVNPKPTAAFSYSLNPCGGGVYYSDASTASITAWNWSLQPVPAITSTLQNPYHFYPNGGTFTVSLIVSNQFGCLDTNKQVLSVPVPPPLSINAATTICNGNSIQLLATGGVSYSWSPGATLSATNIANPIATPTISTGYSVVITTSNNCSFLLLTSVFVNNLSSTPISVTATPTRVVQGGTTTLQYFGDAGLNVSWNPGTFVTPKTGATVTAQPDRPTTYTVIVSNGPCKDTLYVFVDVVLSGCEEGDAFVPNTFTPNGDGQNDVLYARGLKMEELYFAVYNRWGEKVFETTDKKVGWDGIYKGRPADVGVFGWYLKVKCYDGNETFKKGNVTLIR